MNEELSPNEDVIRDRQTQKVVSNRGRTVNRQRRYVSAGAVIFWLCLALAGLCLWLLKLLGVVSL